MSVLSERVKDALYSKLNVASVVGSGKATAVYYQHAPETATLPYIVFSRSAPGPVTFTVFGPTNILENDLWMIKAITDESSSTTQSPSKFGQSLLALAETAIGNSLTVPTATVEFIARISDIPEYRELVNDRFIYHQGFNLRIAVEAQ